ncbi:MAG: hypothetical protein ACXABY_32665 [Candidatus Thorarchaeota archaeon]|jgi:hypothetical protein
MPRKKLVIVETTGINLDTRTEEGRFNNLLLNITAGLKLEDLTMDERKLLVKHGYPLPSLSVDNIKRRG